MEGVLQETAIQAKSLLRGVCLKGWGTGSRDSGCWEQSFWGCWNRRSMNQRSMNQGFRRAGTRESVGARVSEPHGARDVPVRQLAGLVGTIPSRQSDKGLSVGAHSWLQGNLQGLWLPGIPGGCDLGRAQHCQAGRNAVRQGETLAGGVHNAGGARHPFSNCWFRLARGSLARACLTLEPLSHWGPVSHWGQSCMEGAVCFLW